MRLPPEQTGGRPLFASSAAPPLLLTCPRPGGGVDLGSSDRFTNDDVDPLGNDEKFSGNAQQGSVCSALASAMREIAFSIECRRTPLVARQDLWVDEKDPEHGVGLLMDGRPD